MSNIETALESMDRLIAEAKGMPFSSKLLIDEEEINKEIDMSINEDYLNKK